MKKTLKIMLLACVLACVAVCSVMFAACGEAKRLSDEFTVTFELEDASDTLIMSITNKFKVSFVEEDGTAVGSTSSGGSGVNLTTDTNSATISTSEMTGTVIIVGLKSVPSGYAYVDENGDEYELDGLHGRAFDLTKVSSGTIVLKKVN